MVVFFAAEQTLARSLAIAQMILKADLEFSASIFFREIQVAVRMVYSFPQ
jgi:hypothetical protein